MAPAPFPLRRGLALLLLAVSAGCGVGVSRDDALEGTVDFLTSEPGYDGQVHSTMSQAVVGTLREAVARGDRDRRRFIKIGDAVLSSDLLDRFASERTTMVSTMRGANLEATRRAWPMTIGFFRKHLGS